jgi:hypothetical protein
LLYLSSFYFKNDTHFFEKSLSFSTRYLRLTPLNLKELPITETELKLMAAAAMTGVRSRPKKGYKIPAAMGTPREL